MPEDYIIPKTKDEILSSEDFPREISTETEVLEEKEINNGLTGTEESLLKEFIKLKFEVNKMKEKRE